MGSITARKRKDGTTAYMAQIVLKHEGQIAHRENKTFPARREAAGWIARREDELTRQGARERINDPIFAEVINRYTTESLKQIGRTELHHQEKERSACAFCGPDWDSGSCTTPGSSFSCPRSFLMTLQAGIKSGYVSGAGLSPLVMPFGVISTLRAHGALRLLVLLPSLPRTQPALVAALHATLFAVLYGHQSDNIC